MTKDMPKRISKERDVNDSGQPIFRPPEKKSQPIKPRWVWIWLVIVVLVLLVWVYLFWYFSFTQAPFAAPIR